MNMKTDFELYNLYLAGDGASYDELMIRYGDALTVYLNGYVHNLQDAEDLMIEVFARIMAKKPSIRDGGFKAYLYKTARNLATRFHIRKSRMETFSLDSMEEESRSLIEAEIASGRGIPGAPRPTESAGPEQEILDKEEYKLLHLCLENIEPELKEALWLVYASGMSYLEAAKIMKVSSKRIDRLVQRGKEQLRNELSKEGVAYANQ